MLLAIEMKMENSLSIQTQASHYQYKVSSLYLEAVSPLKNKTKCFSWINLFL